MSAQEISTENTASVSHRTNVKSEDERDQFFNRMIQLGLFNLDGFFSDFVVNELIEDTLPLGFDEVDVYNKILKIGRDKFVEDVKLMIPFAVERGNNLEKIATHSSAAAIREINRLTLKYCLVSKATYPTSITLDRVCLVFPMFTCQYMPVARNPVVDKNILLSVCSDYPLVMMHKAFGTLIPNSLSEECKKIIIDAHCLHQTNFCAIIGRSRDKSNKKARDYIGSSP